MCGFAICLQGAYWISLTRHGVELCWCGDFCRSSVLTWQTFFCSLCSLSTLYAIKEGSHSLLCSLLCSVLCSLPTLPPSRKVRSFCSFVPVGIRLKFLCAVVVRLVLTCFLRACKLQFSYTRLISIPRPCLASESFSAWQGK